MGSGYAREKRNLTQRRVLDFNGKIFGSRYTPRTAISAVAELLLKILFALK